MKRVFEWCLHLTVIYCCLIDVDVEAFDDAGSGNLEFETSSLTTTTTTMSLLPSLFAENSISSLQSTATQAQTLPPLQPSRSSIRSFGDEESAVATASASTIASVGATVGNGAPKETSIRLISLPTRSVLPSSSSRFMSDILVSSGDSEPTRTLSAAPVSISSVDALSTRLSSSQISSEKPSAASIVTSPVRRTPIVDVSTPDVGTSVTSFSVDRGANQDSVSLLQPSSVQLSLAPSVMKMTGVVAASHLSPSLYQSTEKTSSTKSISSVDISSSSTTFRSASQDSVSLLSLLRPSSVEQNSAVEKTAVYVPSPLPTATAIGSVYEKETLVSVRHASFIDVFTPSVLPLRSDASLGTDPKQQSSSQLIVSPLSLLRPSSVQRNSAVERTAVYAPGHSSASLSTPIGLVKDKETLVSVRHASVIDVFTPSVLPLSSDVSLGADPKRQYSSQLIISPSPSLLSLSVSSTADQRQTSSVKDVSAIAASTPAASDLATSITSYSIGATSVQQRYSESQSIVPVLTASPSRPVSTEADRATSSLEETSVIDVSTSSVRSSGVAYSSYVRPTTSSTFTERDSATSRLRHSTSSIERKFAAYISSSGTADSSNVVSSTERVSFKSSSIDVISGVFTTSVLTSSNIPGSSPTQTAVFVPVEYSSSSGVSSIGPTTTVVESSSDLLISSSAPLALGTSSLSVTIASVASSEISRDIVVLQSSSRFSSAVFFEQPTSRLARSTADVATSAATSTVSRDSSVIEVLPTAVLSSDSIAGSQSGSQFIFSSSATLLSSGVVVPQSSSYLVVSSAVSIADVVTPAASSTTRLRNSSFVEILPTATLTSDSIVVLQSSSQFSFPSASLLSSSVVFRQSTSLVAVSSTVSIADVVTSAATLTTVSRDSSVIKLFPTAVLSSDSNIAGPQSSSQFSFPSASLLSSSVVFQQSTSLVAVSSTVSIADVVTSAATSTVSRDSSVIELFPTAVLSSDSIAGPQSSSPFIFSSAPPLSSGVFVPQSSSYLVVSSAVSIADVVTPAAALTTGLRDSSFVEILPTATLTSDSIVVLQSSSQLSFPSASVSIAADVVTSSATSTALQHSSVVELFPTAVLTSDNIVVPRSSSGLSFFSSAVLPEQSSSLIAVSSTVSIADAVTSAATSTEFRYSSFVDVLPTAATLTSDSIVEPQSSSQFGFSSTPLLSSSSVFAARSTSYAIASDTTASIFDISIATSVTLTASQDSSFIEPTAPLTSVSIAVSSSPFSFSSALLLSSSAVFFEQQSRSTDAVTPTVAQDSSFINLRPTAILTSDSIIVPQSSSQFSTFSSASAVFVPESSSRLAMLSSSTAPGDTSFIELVSTAAQSSSQRILLAAISSELIVSTPSSPRSTSNFDIPLFSSSTDEISVATLLRSSSASLRTSTTAVVGVYSSSSVFSSVLMTTMTTPSHYFPSPSPTPVVDARLYPYGTYFGDRKLEPGDDLLSPPIHANDHLGFLFFDRIWQSLRIGTNGLISFGAGFNSYSPRTFPWVPRPLIAPFWTDIDTSASLNSRLFNDTGIYYQDYNRDRDNSTAVAILDRISDDVTNSSARTDGPFSATWALIVTWRNVPPFTGDKFQDEEKATFQAVLVTDSVRSYVIFLYPSNGIQWPSHRHSKSVVVGYNAGNYRSYYNHEASTTDAIFDIDATFGNVPNVRGKYVFRVDSDAAAVVVGNRECLAWYKDEVLLPLPSSISISVSEASLPFELEPSLPSCPCTLFQAIFDARFRFRRGDGNLFCAYLSFPDVEYREVTCCYELGGLVFDSILSGLSRLSRRNAIFESRLYVQDDLRPEQWCCRDSTLCHLFREKRPQLTCEHYVAPEGAFIFGDPHLQTLDGNDYTFNGLGEYHLLIVSDDDGNDDVVHIQARTAPAPNGARATVFTAVVVKQVGSATVQVELGSSTELLVYVDGNETFVGDWAVGEGRTFNGTATLEASYNGSLFVNFASGLRVAFLPNEDGNAASTFVSVPRRFYNRTRGLLGLFNGDVEDDFLIPNGTILPRNLTEEQYFYWFGEKWRIREEESLFTYRSGLNASSFNDPTFLPDFSQPVIANSSFLAEVEALCGGDRACFYDAARTGSTSFAAATRQSERQFSEDKKELGKVAPTVKGPSVINVTVSQSIEFQLSSADGVSYNLLEPVAGLFVDSNGSVKWEPPASIRQAVPWQLQIIATTADGASTEYWPYVRVCDCANNGTCDFGGGDEAYDATRTLFLPCLCSDAYDGVRCDEDRDGCADDPCLGGCRDKAAPESGFSCDPCPNGYRSEGLKCLDIDECSEGKSDCQQVCINTAGNYSCSCRNGYELDDNDGKSCLDINECQRGVDCRQTCDNTNGSYSCGCFPGYSLESNGRDCRVETPCHNDGCSQLCAVVNGTSICSCNVGYVLTDATTCTPCDRAKFGLDCSFTCGCQNGAFCNRISGCDCSTSPGWTGLKCEVEINAHRPVFDRASYIVHVAENASVGTFLVELNATDDDANAAGDVEFRLVLIGNVESASVPYFHVDVRSGVVQVAKLLDREQTATHVLAVEARDKGTQSQKTSLASLVVELDDVNDNDPIFEPAVYAAAVRETATPGTVVAEVTCTDKDSLDDGKLTLVIDGEVKDFIIDRFGVVRVAASLDFEKTTSYLLPVVCRDAVGHDASASIAVAILPVNDFGPAFVNGSFVEVNVREDVAVGRYVARLTAIDADRGRHGVVSYNITSGNEARTFGIERRTGLLWVRVALDRENVAAYNLTVVASDEGVVRRVASIRVAIRILDANDNAPILLPSLSRVNVSENAPNGSSVARMTCTDEDDHDVRFVVGGGNANGSFAVDLNGTIRTNRRLDYESIDSFTLTVICFDSLHRSDVAVVIIDVLPVNEFAPTFSSKTYNTTIAENRLVGTYVTFVSAVDPDGGKQGEITYDIVDGNDGDVFAITSNSGGIWLRNAVDRETKAQYSLTVEVVDNDEEAALRRSADASVVIRIGDVNDNAPVFSSTVYVVNVTENTTAGAVVGRVACTDADSSDSGLLRYSIDDGDPKGDFLLNSSGVIETTSQLDYEERSHFVLSISCIDTALHFSNASVAVRVLPVNEHAPRFVKPKITETVPEDLAIGSLLAKFNATDLDAGRQGRVTYELTAGNGDGSFAIDSVGGAVWLVKALDRETKDSYSVTVTAADDSIVPKSATALLDVAVSDVNDNGPQFQSPSVASISEDSTTGVSVASLTAEDKDDAVNSQVTYRIQSGNVGSTFSIGSNSGLIRLEKSLDYETQTSFFLTVVARETALPNREAIAVQKIEVENVNDNPPRFLHSDYRISLSESAPVNHVVTHVQAHDPDNLPTTTIFYEFYGGDDGKTFMINQTSGDITLENTLDYAKRTSYSLVVSARDGKYLARATVSVEVVNVEDPPRFDPKLPYTRMLVTNASFPQRIIDVSATDKDGDKLTYNIVSGNGTAYVSIVPDTGSLSAHSVPPIHVTVLVVTVRVIDDTNRQDFVDVVIVVVQHPDPNEFAPKFSQSTYNISAPYGFSNGTPILDLIAFDEDNRIPNRRRDQMLRYSLRGNDSRAFEVNETSGTIRTTIGYESVPRPIHVYDFVAVVVDDGVPPLDDTARVVVTVELELCPPEFVGSDLSNVTIAEDAKLPRVLKAYEAEVPDYNRDGSCASKQKCREWDCSYSIEAFPGQENFARLFDVDSNALLTVRETVDYERYREGKLYVVVTVPAEKWIPPRRDRLLVTVRVTDANDNAPVFASSAYACEVYSAETNFFDTLFVVKATDADSGTNGEVVYDVARDDVRSTARDFSSVKSDGEFFFNAPQPTSGKYSLVVQAKDRDPNSVASANTTIYVDVYSGDRLVVVFLDHLTRERYNSSSSDLLAALGTASGGTAKVHDETLFKSVRPGSGDDEVTVKLVFYVVDIATNADHMISKADAEKRSVFASSQVVPLILQLKTEISQDFHYDVVNVTQFQPPKENFFETATGLAIIGTVSGVVVFAVLLLCICCLWKRGGKRSKRSRRRQQQNKSLVTPGSTPSTRASMHEADLADAAKGGVTNEMELKHMVGADPIMGRTFRTPWWDPTYDAGHMSTWAPHPEPGKHGDSQYGSSAQASLSAEALNRFSQLKPVNHSTESLLDEHPRTGDLRRKVTFFQPDKVDLPDLESDDYYKRYFGSELQESARGSSKFATEAARRKRQEKKQLASALYDDSQY